MLQHALQGMAAGAVGTAALDIVSYADMALRGRPASQVPAHVAGALAAKVGIRLSAADAGANDDSSADNRRSGIGALLGYATGLGIGAAYGVLRPYVRALPLPVAGVGATLAAMATSDVPATALGVTDPRSWSARDWTLDVGFHLAYGLATAIAFEAFTTDGQATRTSIEWGNR